MQIRKPPGALQLACWAHADLSLYDDVGHVAAEVGSKARHEILVHIQRRAILEELFFIDTCTASVMRRRDREKEGEGGWVVITGAIPFEAAF